MKAQEHALDRLKGHSSGKIRGVKKLTKNSNAVGKDTHPIRREMKTMDTMMPAAQKDEVRTHFKADHVLAKRFPALYAKQVINAQIRDEIRDERGSSTSNDRGNPPLSSGLGGQPSASGGSG